MSKRIFSILSFVALAAILTIITGCAGFGGGASGPSPAQIATAVCLPTQSVLTILQADTGIAGSGQAVIKKMVPEITNICNAASTATATDLTTLTNFAFKVILPIAQETHPELVPQLQAVEDIAGIVEAVVIKPVAPAVVTPAT